MSTRATVAPAFDGTSAVAQGEQHSAHRGHAPGKNGSAAFAQILGRQVATAGQPESKATPATDVRDTSVTAPPAAAAEDSPLTDATIDVVARPEVTPASLGHAVPRPQKTIAADSADTPSEGRGTMTSALAESPGAEHHRPRLPAHRELRTAESSPAPNPQPAPKPALGGDSVSVVQKTFALGSTEHGLPEPSVSASTVAQDGPSANSAASEPPAPREPHVADEPAPHIEHATVSTPAPQTKSAAERPAQARQTRPQEPQAAPPAAIEPALRANIKESIPPAASTAPRSEPDAPSLVSEPSDLAPDARGATVVVPDSFQVSDVPAFATREPVAAPTTGTPAQATEPHFHESRVNRDSSNQTSHPMASRAHALYANTRAPAEDVPVSASPWREPGLDARSNLGAATGTTKGDAPRIVSKATASEVSHAAVDSSNKRAPALLTKDAVPPSATVAQPTAVAATPDPAVLPAKAAQAPHATDPARPRAEPQMTAAPARKAASFFRATNATASLHPQATATQSPTEMKVSTAMDDGKPAQAPVAAEGTESPAPSTTVAQRFVENTDTVVKPNGAPVKGQPGIPDAHNSKRPADMRRVRLAEKPAADVSVPKIDVPASMTAAPAPAPSVPKTAPAHQPPPQSAGPSAPNTGKTVPATAIATEATPARTRVAVAPTVALPATTTTASPTTLSPAPKPIVTAPVAPSSTTSPARATTVPVPRAAEAHAAETSAPPAGTPTVPATVVPRSSRTKHEISTVPTESPSANPQPATVAPQPQPSGITVSAHAPTPAPVSSAKDPHTPATTPPRPAAVPAKSVASTKKGVAETKHASRLTPETDDHAEIPVPSPRPAVEAFAAATPVSAAPQIEPKTKPAEQPPGPRDLAATNATKAQASTALPDRAPAILQAHVPTPLVAQPAAPVGSPFAPQAVTSLPTVDAADAPMAEQTARLVDRAIDDPGLSVAVLPHAAHLSITSNTGDLALHVRVRDGNADVNVSGSMAPLFDSKAPEVRTVLAGEGLNLGSFATDQRGQSDHRHQPAEPAPQSDSRPTQSTARHTTAATVVAPDDHRIHVTA